jgi:hypothetical protein
MMGTPVALSPPQEWSSAMQRRHFKQTVSLDQRLSVEAQRLRKEAWGTRLELSATT